MRTTQCFAALALVFGTTSANHAPQNNFKSAPTSMIDGINADGSQWAFEMGRSFSGEWNTLNHFGKNNGNSYAFFKEPRRTYQGAVDFCKALGAFPVTIADEAERDFVISIVDNNRHGFWLGARRTPKVMSQKLWKKKNYGYTVWSTGEKVKYSSWATGEPNSKIKGGEWVDRCLFQGFNRGNPSLWNDASCEIKKRVVCERPAGYSTITTTSFITTSTTATSTSVTATSSTSTTTSSTSTTTSTSSSTSTSSRTASSTSTSTSTSSSTKTSTSTTTSTTSSTSTSTSTSTITSTSTSTTSSSTSSTSTSTSSVTSTSSSTSTVSTTSSSTSSSTTTSTSTPTSSTSSTTTSTSTASTTSTSTSTSSSTSTTITSTTTTNTRSTSTVTSTSVTTTSSTSATTSSTSTTTSTSTTSSTSSSTSTSTSSSSSTSSTTRTTSTSTSTSTSTTSSTSTSTCAETATCAGHCNNEQPLVESCIEQGKTKVEQCWCDDMACVFKLGKCCADYADVCTVTTPPASSTPPCAAKPAQCGTPDVANNKNTHCDLSEKAFDVLDCEGNISGASCSCHATCTFLGDCCHDYVDACNNGERVPMLTTSSAKTPTLTSCADFKCAKDCGVTAEQSLGLSQFSACGWSSKKQQCVAGSRTTKKEADRNECALTN